MSELRELYQEVILDHYKRPRNFRVLEGASHEAEGYNPLCGDRVRIYAEIEDGCIKDVAFQGEGCAISKASASIMTETVKGKSLQEADRLFEAFHRLLTEAPADHDEAGPEMGKLAVFSGVRDYPVRIKCATLVWHTLKAAVEKRSETVSTE